MSLCYRSSSSSSLLRPLTSALWKSSVSACSAAFNIFSVTNSNSCYTRSYIFYPLTDSLGLNSAESCFYSFFILYCRIWFSFWIIFSLSCLFLIYSFNNLMWVLRLASYLLFRSKLLVGNSKDCLRLGREDPFALCSLFCGEITPSLRQSSFFLANLILCWSLQFSASVS